MTDQEYQSWQERISAAETEGEFRELDRELAAALQGADEDQEAELRGLAEQLSLTALAHGIDLDAE